MALLFQESMQRDLNGLIPTITTKSIPFYKFDIGRLCSIWKSSLNCEDWHLHHKIQALFDEVIEPSIYLN